MSIFSGLEEFGLGKMKDIDVYDDNKHGNGNADALAKAEKQKH